MATLIEGSFVKLARTFEEHGRGPDWVQALNGSGVGADIAKYCGDPHKVDREVLRQALTVKEPTPPILTPKEIVSVRIKVDWDEPLEAKVKRGKGETIAWATDIATDHYYPCAKTGKGELEGLMVHFGCLMPQEAIEAYAASVGEEVAHPKALADLMLSNPRPALDEQMPLVAPVFWAYPGGNRCALYDDRGDFDGRALYDVWLVPGGEWGDGWWFLLLRVALGH